jgi:hypothetical protein
MSSYLFAIDEKIEEVIVSASAKGSKKIDFIERVARIQNEELYQSVVTLTKLAGAVEFDLKEFKAIDKACQGLYAGYKRGK